MKVIVIGGGPAGMMAAIAASQNGNQVILIEKMQSLGRKLLITGKGRCNITSSLSMEEFIKNTPGNGMFLYSCYQRYNNQDIIKFLDEQGLKVKEERGNRIFPITDKSQDVLRCFTKKLKELDVEIKYNTKVEEIILNEDKELNIKEVVGVRTTTEVLKADKIILATGGKSYPLTGSTGDGYKLAQKLGHTITKIKPSLVPLEIYEKDICKNLQGLSLRNVNIKMIDNENKKIIYEDFGEMIFTHFGVSGPIILSSSAHLVRYKNIEEKMQNKNIILSIDFKPALSEKKLDERILRDFKEFKNKQFKNCLDKLLPQKLIPSVVEISNINPNKKVNEITKEERSRLVKLLKSFKTEIKQFRPIDEAIITSGGIKIKEINPKTMESKIVRNLYFAGEIIDVDSYTGGFNLQIAYSTGFVAGSL
ncbi:MAG: NAD(P)/FAD-dependent oxidoreductase [Clostridia bacterium]|nr:NAD(P)/FAD-dependent oxidoreductase [Clostridia bacterium]